MKMTYQLSCLLLITGLGCGDPEPLVLPGVPVSAAQKAAPEAPIETLEEIPERECPLAYVAIRNSDGVEPISRRIVLPGGELTFDTQTADGFSTNLVLLEKPELSYAAPVHEETSSVLHFDAVGEYTVEAQVIDNAAGETCNSSTATVLAHKSAGTRFRIELTWTSPNGGVRKPDLDLHYRRAGSTYWNNAPEDVFWRNATADWGDGGIARHQTDETDLGMEVIIHDFDGSQGQFEIGVYNYNDKGLGPTVATVRVFEYGVLLDEGSRESVGKGHFWGPIVLDAATSSMNFENAIAHPGFPIPPI